MVLSFKTKSIIEPDFNETNTSSEDFIKNKPTIPSGNQIIDWTSASAGTIDNSNLDNNIPYSKLTGTPSNNQIIDWTGASAGTIHASNYTDTNTQLGTASSSSIGGIKIGYSENDKNYPVELSNEKAFVNVPWTDTQLGTGIGDGNVLPCNSSVGVNDYLKVNEAGTKVRGRDIGQVRQDLSLEDDDIKTIMGGIGIGNGNVLTSNGAVNNNEYLKIDGTRVEGKTINEVKSDLNIDTIENNISTNTTNITNVTTLALTASIDTTNLSINGGKTGIGLSSSALATLHVGGDAGGADVLSARRRRFRYNSNLSVSYVSSTSFSIYSEDSIITGNYIISHSGTLSSSDDRIKSEETPIQNATQTLLQLTPKNYYKHNKYRVAEDDESEIPEKDSSGNIIEKYWESGLIAQEMETIPDLAHLVLTGPDMNIAGAEELKVVNYEGLIPFLVKSIQELNARILELEK